MHFITESNWADTNPIHQVFEDPDNPSFHWHAVQLTSFYYYYHIYLVLRDTVNYGNYKIHLILGEITDVIDILKSHPESTVYLQTPAWDNDGDLGIYKIDKIFKPYGHKRHYAIDIESSSETLNPSKLKKDTVWTSPRPKKM